MAKVKRQKVDVKLTVLLELDELEVMALDGIFGYNVEAFLKAFYEKMGKSYVRPHEEGVRSLHDTVRNTLKPAIKEVRQVREAVNAALRY